jgi:hypothetical protein
MRIVLQSTQDNELEMRMKKLLVFCGLLLVLSPVLAATPFWGSAKPVSFDTPPDLLKNGEFTWDPEIAPAGPIRSWSALTNSAPIPIAMVF